MAKQDKGDNKTNDDAIDELAHELLDIIKRALRDETMRDLIPVAFLVNADDMRVLVRLQRAYKALQDKKKLPDAEQVRVTSDALMHVWRHSAPLTQKHMDMIAEGLELLNKKEQDAPTTSSEQEDATDGRAEGAR